MSKGFAEKIIDFNLNLHYRGRLPPGFHTLNPFRQNQETLEVMQAFYRKFYNDNKPRSFIIGINPSRHGAGVTGIPFTDTKRLESEAGIEMQSARTHEVSSVFLYEVIRAYGGAKKFYQDFYINSPFPLAIVREGGRGLRNANYYDERFLYKAVENFMINKLREQIDFGLNTGKALVLGIKNLKFIEEMNAEAKLFDELVAVEHPRFVQQYKSKEKDFYIEKYLTALRDIRNQ